MSAQQDFNHCLMMKNMDKGQVKTFKRTHTASPRSLTADVRDRVKIIRWVGERESENVCPIFIFEFSLPF